MHLENLETLILRECGISDIGIVDICATFPSQIKILNLTMNAFTDAGVQEIINFIHCQKQETLALNINLKKLSIRNENISKPIYDLYRKELLKKRIFPGHGE